MDVGENGGSLSVAEEPLSSPPSSMSDLSPPRSNQGSQPHARDATTFGVSAPPPPPSSINSPLPHSATPTTTATAPSSGNEQKPRKKREPVVLPDGTVRERKKPGPKPKPKDPNAPVQPRKKKQKMSDAPTSAPPPNIQLQQSTLQVTRQPKIADLVAATPSTASQLPSHANSETHLGSNAPGHVAPLGTPNTPRPASSGQLFDVIRGDTVQAGQASSRVSTASPTATHNPGRLVPSTSNNVTSAPVSPLPPAIKSTNPFTAPPNSALGPRSSASVVPSVLTPSEMEVDQPKPGSVEPSSNAPTPPPTKQRAKELPPPLPTGSGLLAGTPFGIGSAPVNTGSTGANIWLTFPLKGQTNVTINYAREVERKYGFAALHPRLAAQNERRRAMAAASNALEKGEKAAGIGSADDMSLDLSEAESNAEMGGIDDENSTSGLPDGRKRRRRKAEDYDRNDEFIDDTEMAWEEQALMAKDGFFVYSGPLVTESEKPTIERYILSISNLSNSFANIYQCRWNCKAWPRTRQGRHRAWRRHWSWTRQRWHHARWCNSPQTSRHQS
jgi:hypothetical protein